MESSLRKILTPTSSLDLLREIDAVTSPSTLSLQKRRPYVISIVGVNGVGKSTNLSKICYFLLQNKYKVLVVACDTFRSGAVEQLAVHVRNLKELSSREGGEVELYQKGYGKDAANVAKDAVTFADQEGFDVVLIDTAGRRHNDQVSITLPPSPIAPTNPARTASNVLPREIRQIRQPRQDPHGRRSARRNRLRSPSAQLQRGFRHRTIPRRLHHLQMRYGG